MFDEENQMGLFEIPGAQQELKVSAQVQPPPAATKSAPAASRGAAPVPPAKTAPAPAKRPGPARTAAPAAKKRKAGAAPVKKVSGQVPEGDVRLTANIRQDLHLKLKIASAHRRTTIGEILEELIEEYL